MIDKLYFLYCILLTFSGFVIGFYGIMARHKIELETKNGLNKGFDFDSDEGTFYFAKKFENWNAGSYFDSQLAPFSGILIALVGAGVNLNYNSWWTSLLLLFIAYITYLLVVNLLKSRIQILSILTLLVSIVLIILN
jgi:hypothetical protein